MFFVILFCSEDVVVERSLNSWRGNRGDLELYVRNILETWDVREVGYPGEARGSLSR